jgi:hypothetical protein
MKQENPTAQITILENSTNLFSFRGLWRAVKSIGNFLCSALNFCFSYLTSCFNGNSRQASATNARIEKAATGSLNSGIPQDFITNKSIMTREMTGRATAQTPLPLGPLYKFLSLLSTNDEVGIKKSQSGSDSTIEIYIKNTLRNQGITKQLLEDFMPKLQSNNSNTIIFTEDQFRKFVTKLYNTTTIHADLQITGDNIQKANAILADLDSYQKPNVQVDKARRRETSSSLSLQ